MNIIAEGLGQCDIERMSRGAAAARVERTIRIAIVAIAALIGIMTPAHAQPIVAVGDLHGDYKAWQDIARGAGIIDARGHWAAGKTILVQLGDVTDRGPDSLKIVRSLQQLQKEAPRAGGKAIVVLGNHEAMNLIGDNRYTTPGEYAAFADSQSAQRRDRVYEANRATLEAAYKAQNPKITPDQVRSSWMAAHPLGWAEHRLAWGPSGDLGKWATRNPAVVKIGGTLFVHGGLSAEYARLPLEEINRRAAAAMAAGNESLTAIISDPLGPLWYRGLIVRDADAETARAAAKPPQPRLTPDQELTAVLAAYGAQRIVVGHTPRLKGIEIGGNGRLAAIDTGDSSYYGGPLSWLEINGNVMTPHTVPRSP